MAIDIKTAELTNFPVPVSSDETPSEELLLLLDETFVPEEWVDEFLDQLGSEPD